MKQKVELIPDLRTSGGEVLDIMVNDQYAGSLLLVYREGDRLSGSLQMERELVSADEEKHIIDQVHAYIRSLTDAVEAIYYEVLVSCGTLHSVLQNLEFDPERESDDMHYESDEYLDDLDDMDVDDSRVIPDAADQAFTYEDREHVLEMELVTAGRSISTYVFNDADGTELAEASLKQYGADIQGEIHWYDVPLESQLDAAAELLVRELDEEVIDTITLRMWHQGNELESMEWVHRDFVDDSEEEEFTEYEDWDDSEDEIDEAEDSCYVMLVRKDREFRVYELFLQERGGLPVGTATIDTSHADLTGYMDYQVPGTSAQRRDLVEVLLQELDKDLEFDTLHLTMLYRNQIIDEAKIDG